MISFPINILFAESLFLLKNNNIETWSQYKKRNCYLMVLTVQRHISI